MRPQISIVVSLYQSARFVAEFHRRISQTAGAITPDFEVIYVDDGSPDDSQALVRQIVAQDPKARLIVLSRNFGHFAQLLRASDKPKGSWST